MNSFVVLLPWVLGLSLLLQVPDWRLEALCLMGLAGAWLGIGCLPRWRASHGASFWLAGLVWAVSMGAWLGGTATERFAPWTLDSNQVYEVKGTIEGLPSADRFGQQVRVRIDCVSSVASTCDLFNSYNRIWPVLVDVGAPSKKWPAPPLPGQRWVFNVHGTPAPSTDPLASFNLARWLKSVHVVARFRARSSDSLALLNQQTDRVQMARLVLRHQIEQKLQAAPAGAALSGLPVVLALITGDRSLMTPEHWRIFNNTGTTHLVAISGAHIMLVTGVIVWVLNLLLKRVIWLTQRLPSLNVALVLGWCAAMGYGAIAGFGFPVQRALIMLSMLVVFKLWGRAQPLWLACNLAFFLVLAWDPMAVFSIGFWLSFIAVYWILWVGSGNVLKVSRTQLWWRIQSGIFFGLAPVLLWQLQNLSLVSGGTNLFAIPVVGMVLTPLSLLWALAWSVLGDNANLLLEGADGLAQVALWLLRWCADTPYSVVSTTPHGAGFMLLALLGVVWLCTPGWPARWLAPVLVVPLLLPAAPVLGLKVSAGGTAPRVHIDTGDRLLFISKTEWPSLDSRWQQGWLRVNGIPPVANDLVVQRAGDYWHAPYWVLTDFALDQNVLGMRKVVGQEFVDLCAEKVDQQSNVPFHVLYRNPKGSQCVTLLNWQEQRILLLSSTSLKAQKILLEKLQRIPAPTVVMLHPQKSDRYLPGLLTFLQAEAIPIYFSAAPPLKIRTQFEASGLQWQVLAESGPLALARSLP